jgi:hypothetical protein
VLVTTGRKVTLLVRGGEFDIGKYTKGDRIDVNDKPDGTVTARLLRGGEAQAKSA